MLRPAALATRPRPRRAYRMRYPLAVAIGLAALTACGDDGEPASDRPSKPRVVAGTLELDRPPAPVDAGTAAGHRAPDGIGSTRRASLVVRGTVAPARSAVIIRNARTRRRAPGRVAAGRFAVVASHLRRGPNRFVIEARAPGHRPWTADVTITRG